MNTERLKNYKGETIVVDNNILEDYWWNGVPHISLYLNSGAVDACSTLNNPF
jgi:hypothetical protein